MKIGLPFGVEGLGGIRSWVKVFSEYGLNKGHQVSFNHDEDVDVFITIANSSRYEELIRLKRNGAKIIHRIDGLFFDYHLFSHESSDHFNELLAKNMNLADLIVCQSKFTDELVTYLLGQDNKIPRTIIYNGANKELFSPSGMKIPREGSKKMILSIAYWGVPLMADFSINTIINVAKLLPEYEFWILGLAYPKNEQMIKEAKLGNITKVNLSKAVPRENMPQYLRSADLVLHSRPHDACSNLILEAMSVNIPIVGLESGSTAELLGDAGLRGECIGDFKKLPIVNCEDLAEKIRKTFENYDYYKSEIAERSKLFSNKIMCENYIKECENLLKN